MRDRRSTSETPGKLAPLLGTCSALADDLRWRPRDEHWQRHHRRTLPLQWHGHRHGRELGLEQHLQLSRRLSWHRNTDHRRWWHGYECCRLHRRGLRLQWHRHRHWRKLGLEQQRKPLCREWLANHCRWRSRCGGPRLRHRLFGNFFEQQRHAQHRRRRWRNGSGRRHAGRGRDCVRRRYGHAELQPQWRDRVRYAAAERRCRHA